MDQKKNIIIIGGGIIGASSAYYLTRHPLYNPSIHTITLLEASTIAGGASGKAGGLLARWAYPKAIVNLSYELHHALAEEHDGRARWGYRGVRCGSVECVPSPPSKATGFQTTGKKKKKEGVDGEGEGVSLEKKGPAPTTTTTTTKKVGKRTGDLGVGWPEDLNWVDEGVVRGYDEMGDPSTTAQVHPYLFTVAMVELARERGVKVLEHCAVTGIGRTEDGGAVECVRYTDAEGQEVTIDGVTDVVISAGPWTKSIYPTAPISALRAHSVVIKPEEEVTPYCLFTEIKGKGSPEIYARPGREVYACGEGDRTVPLPKLSSEVKVDERRCQEILDHVSSISTELREGEVMARQACYLPNVDTTGGPLIGLTGVKGEVMAAGHTCWGIQNGPGTGKLVSEFVFEGEAKSAKIKGLDPRLVL